MQDCPTQYRIGFWVKGGCGAPLRGKPRSSRATKSYGFHAKILSSEEAEAIGLPCRTPFVLVEAETGKPIRFYDETNRSRIVKSWRKSGKKALRERITAWVLENKSFLHNVLSIVEKKKNTRGNLDVSDVVHARKKSFLKAGDIPFSKEDLVWFFRSTPEIQWVEREEFEPKE